MQNSIKTNVNNDVISSFCISACKQQQKVMITKYLLSGLRVGRKTLRNPLKHLVTKFKTLQKVKKKDKNLIRAPSHQPIPNSSSKPR